MPTAKPTTAETEGAKAFASGLERSSNPYPPGEQASQWEQGWKRASKSRNSPPLYAKEQEVSNQERAQMTDLDWALHKLTPKRFRHHPSSVFTWTAIGGVIVLIGFVFGFGVLVAFVTFSAFFYGCAAVFVLVRHFAGRYEDQPSKKTLFYTLGGIIGLIIILLAWELVSFVLNTLEFSWR